MEIALPTLTTPKLELRPACDDDLEGYFALEQRCAAVPGSMQYLPRAPAETLEETRTRLSRYQGPFTRERSIFTWFCRKPGSTDIVGYVAFVRWDHDHHRSEIAYVMEPSVWGQGLAGEASAPILDFAWNELSLHRAEARIDPQNGASIRVAEKLGFVFEGVLKESFFVHGRYADTAVYGKIRP